MPKPLVAEGGYPSLKELSCDPVSVRILSSAYATSSGELNAVLQYMYHSFNFARCGNSRTAELLEGVAIAEMKHLKLIGTALINMGASPVYAAQPPVGFNYYSAKFVVYSHTLKNMLEDDVIAEKNAIYGYEKMLTRLKNPIICDLVKRILEDERLHLEAIKKALADC